MSVLPCPLPKTKADLEIFKGMPLRFVIRDGECRSARDLDTGDVGQLVRDEVMDRPRGCLEEDRLDVVWEAFIR